MKRWYVLSCLPWLLAAAPQVPLITGAIRDQLGNPIAGASIQAGAASVLTDAAGTFAVESAAGSVTIQCTFCRSTVAYVAGDGTVTAIVQRYQAPAQEQVSADDIRALPYGHIESAMSLTPFVVLNDSSRLLPGPYLSYYGLSRFGGLVVLNGVPTYDVAAGASALRAIPGYGAVAAAARSAWDEPRYGNLAPGGTFLIATAVPQTVQATALNGTQRAGDISYQTGAAGFDAAVSGDDDGSRQRADAVYSVHGDAGTISANVGASHDLSGTTATLDESSANARLHYDRASSFPVYADLSADDSRYTSVTAGGLPVNGAWSQVTLDAGATTQGKIAAFFDAGSQLATGYYDAHSLGGVEVAGANAISHVSAGVQSRQQGFFWRAVLNAVDAQYTGGSDGTSTPLGSRMVSPSASLAYDVAPGVNLAVDAGRSFRFPTLLETYGYAADLTSLHYDNYAAMDAKLTVTDLRRVRISLLGVRANVSNLDNG
ncbi:MAG TPA: TonB-dependent receptor, partial [Candidatus Baltobacteraceae bacterium]|nr:TonB-dependent receptor [Candidatus Baltobacteraceae bacterium]